MIWFCWHDWSHWTFYTEETLTERRIDDPNGEDRPIGWSIIQQRQCRKCGALAMRKVRP